jgi:predicted RNA-binding protein (virulence factor B family)
LILKKRRIKEQEDLGQLQGKVRTTAIEAFAKLHEITNNTLGHDGDVLALEDADTEQDIKEEAGVSFGGIFQCFRLANTIKC